MDRKRFVWLLILTLIVAVFAPIPAKVTPMRGTPYWTVAVGRPAICAYWVGKDNGGLHVRAMPAFWSLCLVALCSSAVLLLALRRERTNLRLFTILTAIAFSLTIAWGWFISGWPPKWVRKEVRMKYTKRAVDEILRLKGDEPALAKAVQRRLDDIATGSSDGIDRRYLVARNGEWMIFFQEAGKCDRVVGDIFIALGSDGKWYYTKQHICIDMLAFRMDAPFADLQSVQAEGIMPEPLTVFASPDEVLDAVSKEELRY